MALNARIHWEIRPANGTTNAGGGFRGGGWPAAPAQLTLAKSATVGTMANVPYYFVATWSGDNTLGSESPYSTEQTVTPDLNKSVLVTAPASPPSSALYWNLYMGTASGGPYWQQSANNVIGVNKTVSAPVSSGTQAPGTDRSQQNAVQVDIDNATITATTAGAASNVMTFTAGYTPTAADVGNCVAITAGTNINAGIYEITAWTGTTWTVTGAANLTTAGGAGSAIVGKMGGARRGFNDNGGTPTTLLQNVLLAGHTVWVKNEAWNELVSLPTNIGTGANMLRAIGYNTSRGDNPTGSTRPTLNRGGTAGYGFNISAGSSVWYIQSTGSGSSHATTNAGFKFINNGYGYMFYCRSYGNYGYGVYHGGTSGGGYFCEFDHNSGHGIGAGSSVNYWHYSSSHDNALYGIDMGNGVGFLSHCVSSSNADNGVSALGGSSLLLHCISHNNGATSKDGFTFNSPNPPFGIQNCISAWNGQYGINDTTAAQYSYPTPLISGNCYFGNITGTVGGGRAIDSTSVTTDPTFTNEGATTFVDADVPTASPAVFNITAHGRSEGDIVFLSTTGTLPTGFAIKTAYYVKVVNADSFQLSTTRTLNPIAAGTGVNKTGTGSGTHKLRGNANAVFTVGTNMKALGIPTNLNMETWGTIGTTYLDIGTLQRQEAASGGGSFTFG